jgi:hypothetical protein
MTCKKGYDICSSRNGTQTYIFLDEFINVIVRFRFERGTSRIYDLQ